MVTISLFTCIFVLIYKSFTRIYVMIFFCVVILGLKNVNLNNLSL